MEREILNLINNSSNILILTHINPDGDTLGCASAMKAFIEAEKNHNKLQNNEDKNEESNIDILIQIEDNFNFPLTYNFLPYICDSLNFSTLKEKINLKGKDFYDLVIALDVASIDRLVNQAKELFENCKNTIVFDHHKTNKGFAKFNLIKGGISSSAEVLFDFFEKLNIKITPEIAKGLYAGVLTDTGCFKYESTTPHTFQMAAKLAQSGIDTSEIADLCYTNKPKKLILFQSELVNNAQFCLNNKVAFTLITKEIIEKYNAKDEYSEGVCETLRSIAGVEIAFVLKETDNGAKASIRTKEIDATAIAQSFNGGGHKRAAGCTIKESINVAADKMLKQIKQMVQ